MANPTPLSVTSPYARKTLGDIRRFCCEAVGLKKDELSADENSVLNGIINDAVNNWRLACKGLRGFAEAQADFTWISGDDSVALDDEYAELRGRFIYKLTSASEPADKIPIVDEGDYYDSFTGEQSTFENLTTPIARLWRESTTRRRILTISPRPAAGDIFRILYWRHAEILVNDSDTVEAPQEACEGIQLESGSKWCVIRGSLEKANTFAALAGAQLSRLMGVPATEKSAPPRARFFTERGMGGYAGTRQSLPW